MPPSQVAWTLPVTVLVVGLVVGALFVWRQFFAGRSAAAAAAVPGAAPLELRDLEGRRDVLLAQLRELEDTAAKRSPEQLAHERYALELQAARVLRDLERHPTRRGAARAAAAGARAAAATAAAVSAPAPTRNTAASGFLWGIGTAAVIGVLLFYVSRSATTRDEGGSATGNVPAMGRPAASQDAGQAQAPASPEEQALRAALERNPDDFEARIGLAQVYLGRQDMMGVWNETQYVLQRKPNDPRALAYQALVRVAMGQAELAVGMLKQAMAAEPSLIEGYVHLALVYRRLGRNEEAEAVMADALKRFPQQHDPLRAVFDEMRRSVTAQDAAPGEDGANPHAGLADAPAGAPVPAAAAAAPAKAAPTAGRAAPVDTGRTVGGVIELDPALAGQVPAGATLFIVVREARLQRGPPAAVQRLEVSSFPLRFELSDKDSMAGEPLPDPLRIEARIDADGNAMTRDPNDPAVVEDGVRAGTRDLRLVLRRP